MELRLRNINLASLWIPFKQRKTGGHNQLKNYSNGMGKMDCKLGNKRDMKWCWREQPEFCSADIFTTFIVIIM